MRMAQPLLSRKRVEGVRVIQAKTDGELCLVEKGDKRDKGQPHGTTEGMLT